MHDLVVRKLLISGVLIAALLVTAVSCVDEETGETVQSSQSDLSFASSADVSYAGSSDTSYEDSSDTSYTSSADVSNESSADSSVSSPYQEIIDDLEELEKIINELDDLTPDDLEVPEP